MAMIDFKEYLAELDPIQSYSVIPLTGGRVNITVRALKTSVTQAGGGKFPFHQSIVLKYAPPYIAAQGHDAPFSQFRQTIEARALDLFNPPIGDLFPLCRRWDIEVPKLLYNDPKAHILILADLGELDTLTEQIKDMTLLFGKSCKGLQRCIELGGRIGGFFADLHSSSTLHMLGHKCKNYFDNPSTRSTIYNNFIVPVQRRLHEFNIQDAEELYSCITRDYLRSNEVWEQSMTLGDLWTGSILIDWPRVCVIDWEFAGIGRGVNGDMATLLAQLHLQLLATLDESSARDALKTMIESVVVAYRHQCLTRQKGKDVETAPRTKPGVLPDVPLETLSKLRSAYLVHGRKMVNNAIERDWACGCCEDVEKAKRDCKLVKKLVDRGVWYLRRAGADLEEFTEDNNWVEVMKEEGRIIIGLFFDSER